jgi:hypothetical protein
MSGKYKPPDGRTKTIRPESIAEFFARPKKLKYCQPYTSHDRMDTLRTTIQAKAWFLYYLRVILGRLPSHSGMQTRDFASIDAKLSTKIDNLIEEREALRSDYANGDKLIKILLRDLKTLEKRHEIYLADEQKTAWENVRKNRRVASFNTIKERLSDLEEQLRGDDFDVESLLQFYKEYKEAETERKESTKLTPKEER